METRQETRQIRDAQDLETGKLIYIKGHAKATYMSDGRTVEDAINSVSGGDTGGAGEENVQSDWNETNTSSDAYIKNKPTIPAAVTESTISGWGFTKNAGTITGVSANGTSIATSGVANIPAASTSAYGVTKLSSATNSSSTSLAATASAVKAAYDLANSYKGTVTGVKINGTTKNPSSGVVDLGTVITAHQTLKTINGESIVGSGDITIEGGSSDANVQAVDTGDVLDDVNVDYATTAYVDSKVANIDLTSYATITYVDGLVGDINSVLESIIGGGGSNEITFYIDDGGYVTPMTALSNMTWREFINSDYTIQNSMFTGFVLFDVGSYDGIKFYHEEAKQYMTLYNDGISDNVKDFEVIEDGKTYYAI